MKVKSLIRWAAVLCLTTTWLGQTLSALALSPEQIQQKLQEIPVFTISNDKGEILLASGKDKEKKSVVLFISKEEAQKSIQQLKQKNPTQPLQILPISLGRMYQTIRENQSDPNSPLMSLIPITSEVSAAQQLMGPQQQFQGVPLFYATIKIKSESGAAAKEQEAYLTAPDNQNNPMIPFYFEKETIQKLVEDFKKAQPEQANSVQIRVVPLETLLTAFERNDNATEEKAKENMVIVPSRESLQFLQNLPKSEPNLAPAATPSPQKK